MKTKLMETQESKPKDEELKFQSGRPTPYPKADPHNHWIDEDVEVKNA